MEHHLDSLTYRELSRTLFVFFGSLVGTLTMLGLAAAGFGMA